MSRSRILGSWYRKADEDNGKGVVSISMNATRRKALLADNRRGNILRRQLIDVMLGRFMLVKLFEQQPGLPVLPGTLVPVDTHVAPARHGIHVVQVWRRLTREDFTGAKITPRNTS